MGENEKKPIIFSGIQPTGSPTLGNYVGAMRNWRMLQDEYNCIYSVVNMHAITVRQVPAELRRKTMEMCALVIACGIDPKKSILFVQSDVSAHAELSWVLSCSTPFGELSRMTQFKEKSQKHPENINAGLFNYPVLMAADILLYQAALVPVGEDQKQHLELARNICERFNGIYGDVFTMPEPYIPKVGARVMSLADPAKKMSKSDENTNAAISILDEPDVIVKKFKRAVTDSDTVVRFAESKDGINNLMTIYSAVTGSDFQAIEREFEGKGYGYFKEQVGNAVAEHLTPVRTEYKRILSDKAELENIIKDGGERAAAVAVRTIRKVYKKVGF